MMNVVQSLLTPSETASSTVEAATDDLMPRESYEETAVGIPRPKGPGD